MSIQNAIADYIGLVVRLRRLEATKLSTWKRLGYLPDGLYSTFSGVSKVDRRAIVNFYRRGLALKGTCVAATALFTGAVATAMLGLGISTPVAVVAVAATGYATAAAFMCLGPLSSLTRIKRVMYGFPTTASCARRDADEAAWRNRMRNST